MTGTPGPNSSERQESMFDYKEAFSYQPESFLEAVIKTLAIIGFWLISMSLLCATVTAVMLQIAGWW